MCCEGEGGGEEVPDDAAKLDVSFISWKGGDEDDSGG